MLAFKDKLAKKIVDCFIKYNVSASPINNSKIVMFDSLKPLAVFYDFVAAQGGDTWRFSFMFQTWLSTTKIVFWCFWNKLLKVSWHFLKITI